MVKSARFLTEDLIRYMVSRCLSSLQYNLFQLSEVQSETDMARTELSEVRSQYKDCAQEVRSLVLQFISSPLFGSSSSLQMKI